MPVVAMPLTSVSGAPALNVSTVCARHGMPCSSEFLLDSRDDFLGGHAPGAPIGIRSHDPLNRDLRHERSDPRRTRLRPRRFGDESPDRDHPFPPIGRPGVQHIGDGFPFPRLAGQDHIGTWKVQHDARDRCGSGTHEDAADAHPRLTNHPKSATDAQPISNMPDQRAKSGLRHAIHLFGLRNATAAPSERCGERGRGFVRPARVPVIGKAPHDEPLLIEEGLLREVHGIGRPIASFIVGGIERGFLRDDEVLARGCGAPQHLQRRHDGRRDACHDGPRVTCLEAVDRRVAPRHTDAGPDAIDDALCGEIGLAAADHGSADDSVVGRAKHEDKLSSRYLRPLHVALPWLRCRLIAARDDGSLEFARELSCLFQGRREW